MSHLILGIDPGAKGTGFALVNPAVWDTTRALLGVHGRPELLWSTTVRNEDGPLDLRVDPNYLRTCVATMLEVLTDHADQARRVSVAVEGIVAPNPHVGMTNPTAILVAATVFGAIIGRAPANDTVVIRPGGNGSLPFGTYPGVLVSPAERRQAGWEYRPAGAGTRKDQRSAYDVARAAQPLIPRLGTLFRGVYPY